MFLYSRQPVRIPALFQNGKNIVAQDKIGRQFGEHFDQQYKLMSSTWQNKPWKMRVPI